MDRIIKRGRLIFLILLIIALTVTYAVALYKLQIVEGARYYEQSQNSIVTTQTVTAARGNILDRYGRVLVSNRTCNNLTINTTELFEQEDPNAIILELCETVLASGDSYNDELPISMEPPFEYDENMSAIDRACLDEYLADKGLDTDISAVDLMAYFRDRYDIDPNYDSRQMRIIAGVRYALNMHYVVKTADYIFAEDVSIDLITRLMEGDLPGFNVEVSYTREYNTEYAAHILGYVALMDSTQVEEYSELGYSLNALVGQSGAEAAFEEYLHGVDGEARITSTASGTVTSTVYTKEPEPGNHVYLTIDIGLQEVAEQAMASFITEKNEELQQEIDEESLYGEPETELITGGAVVAIDVDTGEPLAIASYPTFDLETFIEDYNELLEDPDTPMVNRAINGLYEPGSTFKPLTAICALDMGLVDVNTTYNCQAVFNKYADQGYAPTCWIYGSGAHGDMNVVHAIENSCNIYFYNVADVIESHGSIAALDEYAEILGLGEYTGIELDESKGAMASAEYKASLYEEGDPYGEWFTGDTLAASIGQSISQFTPIQIANYIATIANGGTRRAVTMLKSVRSYDYSEELYEREPEILSELDMDQEYWDAIHEGMYLVANSPVGTAYSTFGNYTYCDVAAKTGTSQRGDNVANNGVFVCYAPADDPEIAICVVVEKAGSGSSIAGIAKQMLDYYFSFNEGSQAVDTEQTLLH